MGILDLLLEKKDVLAYIEFRYAILNIERQKAIEGLPPESREHTNIKFSARIDELEELKKVIAQGRLKEQSKRYCKQLGL